nr:60S ribosomal protein L13-1-like [Tanacetum cinerariifolium]
MLLVSYYLWCPAPRSAIGGLLFFLPRFGSSNVLSCMVVSANGLTNSVSIPEKPDVPCKLFRTNHLGAESSTFITPFQRNRSLEGLQANVQRLKTFKAKLIIFPRCSRKTKAGDSTPEELATATQVQGPVLAIIRGNPATELVKVTEEMKSFNAFAKILLERTNKRHQGARLKRAAKAEKEEKK